MLKYETEQVFLNGYKKLALKDKSLLRQSPPPWLTLIGERKTLTSQDLVIVSNTKMPLQSYHSEPHRDR